VLAHEFGHLRIRDASALIYNGGTRLIGLLFATSPDLAP